MFMSKRSHTRIQCYFFLMCWKCLLFYKNYITVTRTFSISASLQQKPKSKTYNIWVYFRHTVTKILFLYWTAIQVSFLPFFISCSSRYQECVSLLFISSKNLWHLLSSSSLRKPRVFTKYVTCAHTHRYCWHHNCPTHWTELKNYYWKLEPKFKNEHLY